MLSMLPTQRDAPDKKPGALLMLLALRPQTVVSCRRLEYDAA